MRARVAEKVENCIDSLTLSLSEKAKAFREAGESVVSFGTGEPDFTRRSTSVTAPRSPSTPDIPNMTQ